GTAVGCSLIPDGFSIGNMLIILIVVFAVIFVITMISVHRPARIAAAVSPMEALRYVPQDEIKQTANRRLCRRLTPLGFATMNFSKNKKKAAITMLSLALGGILFMTAAAYMSSFNRDNFARQGYFRDAEFHIYYTQAAVELSENGISGLQASSPLNEEIVTAISNLEGVEKVEQIKHFGVRFDFPQQDEYGSNEMIYPMTAQETEQIEQYLEEGSADYDKLMSGDYILAAGNDVVQEVYGWQFRTGDRITLHYYDGRETAEKEVTILGIVNERFTLEHNGLEGWFLMPEQAILKLVEYSSLNSNLLVKVDEAQETAVGEALEQMVAESTELGLETFAERQAVYARIADQMFGAISGLAVFIMMFSILSMMNTLITNIVTRRQELAMLESIGMGKGQIRKMLLGESLLLVLAAVGVTMTIGTLCGYILSRLLYQNGAFYMAFRFPVGLALSYGGVLTIVPILITLIVMHRFAKDALVERLRGAENG
ncbi:MAG: ABC transporter permease, partial [Acetatifactor sp.]|nr:ABC transporter permease [Acetatifactor sp.]